MSLASLGLGLEMVIECIGQVLVVYVGCTGLEVLRFFSGFYSFIACTGNLRVFTLVLVAFVG